MLAQAITLLQMSLAPAKSIPKESWGNKGDPGKTFLTGAGRYHRHQQAI